MGSAMSLGLISEGADVLAVDVRDEPLQALADEAKKRNGPGQVGPVTADITDPAACEDLVRRAIATFGGLHMLVNNAGIGMQTIRETYMNEPVSFWEADIERWQRMMDVNFKAPFMLAKFAAPHMVAQGWGRIVNVTTSLDTMHRKAYTPYGQSKAALEAATATWAKDLDGTGVTANVLVPGGPTNTGFIPANAPFDRAALVQPTVMVAPILWFASDASDGITDCRFVGNDFDPALPAAEAAAAASAPAAWPGVGTTAAWPGTR
jgi:3-oxoacyl-[acyl-carrier protein] reductase